MLLENPAEVFVALTVGGLAWVTITIILQKPLEGVDDYLKTVRGEAQRTNVSKFD